MITTRSRDVARKPESYSEPGISATRVIIDKARHAS